MTIEVEITQEHIDRAEAMRARVCSEGKDISERCPLALALRESGFPDARVGIEFWREDKYPLGLTMGIAAQRFSNAFTWGHRIHPQTVTVEAPDDLPPIIKQRTAAADGLCPNPLAGAVPSMHKPETVPARFEMKESAAAR